MTLVKALVIYLILIYFNSTYVFCATGLTNNRIAKYGNCNLTNEKYDTENLLGHTWNFYKIYGKTYLRAVFTVNKTTLPVTYRYRGYTLKTMSAEKKEDFSLNFNCRSPILNKLISKLHFNVDMVNCTCRPGIYVVSKLNFAEFSRFYKYTARQNAFYEFEIAAITARGIILCLQIILDMAATA